MDPRTKVRPQVGQPEGDETTAGGRVLPRIPQDALESLTDDFMTGYRWGYLAGIETGRKQMDDELATIQRSAAEVVHKMAGLDPWDDHVAKVRQHQREACERFRAGVQR